VNETVQIGADTNLDIGLNDIIFSNLALDESGTLTIDVSNGTSGTITIIGYGNLTGILVVNVTDIFQNEIITLVKYPLHSKSRFAIESSPSSPALQCWR
jgi:hypothetical protein